MPHSYARAAFISAKSSANTLIALYCSLINIEIALKDRGTTWKSGHFIGQWLIDEADAGLNSLTQQLTAAFDSIRGTDRKGNGIRLRLDAYPELRYIRHEIDFPGETTDSQLITCLDLVHDIEAILLTKGVL
jgi:hypothetical protein